MVDGRMMVLVIHRTVHGDVTIPKGKVDPGESLPQTAVREIDEETGLTVALGVPVGVSNYPLSSGRTKIVHYWSAEVTDDAIRQLDVRAERRGRRARVGDHQEGAHLPELQVRRRDPRGLRQARRRRRDAHLRARRAAPRQGAGSQRVEEVRMRPARSPSAACARRRSIVDTMLRGTRSASRRARRRGA